MSDPRFTGSAGPSMQNKNAGPSVQNNNGGEPSALEMASKLAKNFKDEASDVARDTSQKLKQHASDATDRAMELASDAGAKLKSTAEEQKNSGADFVSDFAGAVRRAASEFDQQIPQAGQYIRRAAEQIDSASEALRRRDLNQLLGDVQDFARRQPTAFLGGAVLAGFALVRFLKSAAPTPSAVAQDRGYAQDRGA
jgi:gas vesicle protein